MHPPEQTLAILHFLSYQGEKLAKRWPDLTGHLRGLLRQAGVEQKGSSSVMLIFSYPHPHLAVSHVTECLERSKKEFSWQDIGSPLPVQLVFHLPTKDDLTCNIFDLNAEIWNLLQPDKIYVTRTLKLHWDTLMAGRKLPAHGFAAEDGGVFLLELSEMDAIRTGKLFPHREMALMGKHPFCFYCGMTRHEAKDCPSKQLPPLTNALQHAGYLDFRDFSAAFEKAFSSTGKILDHYKQGITSATVRSSKELLVYTAYLDAFRIYQPRFLFKMAFGTHDRWLINDSSEKIEIDNRALNLGLDCLRVGKYSHAERLLVKEGRKFEGKQFYLAVALAFLALEKGRPQEMETYFEHARVLAATEKERVYSGLLLARYLLLKGDFYKARELVKSVIKTKYECYEARYLLAEIDAQDAFSDKTLLQLQTLIEEDRDLFMTALFDPHLMPIHGFVEELQAGYFLKITQQARSSLSEASREVGDLVNWLPEGDERQQQQHAALDSLGQKLARNSFYDLVDVKNMALALVNSCKKQVVDALREQQENIGRETKRLRRLQNFWQSFLYKPFFGSFHESLRKATAKLAEANRLLQSKNSGSFRKATKLLQDAATLLDPLKNQLDRMLLIQSLLDGIKTFGKKLCLTEGIMLALAFFLLHSGRQFFSASAGDIGKLLSGSLALKKVLYLTGLLLAPTVAMILTIWTLRENK